MGVTEVFSFLPNFIVLVFHLYYGFRPSWFGLRVVNMMVVWATVNKFIVSLVELNTK